MGRSKKINKKVKNRNKPLKYVLHICSIVLMLAIFFHQYAKNFTTFCNFITPAYHKGTQAFSKLIDTTKEEQKRIILKGEAGFEVLSELFFKESWVKTGRNIANGDSIVEFRGIGNFSEFKIGGASIPSIMILVKSHDGKEATILSYEVLLSLEKLLDKKLFFLAVILFIIGFILELLTLFLSHRFNW